MPLDPLLFRATDLGARFRSLAERVSKDPATLASFQSDPLGNSLREVFPEQARNLTPLQVSAGNRLLLSVMGNAKFRDWLTSFQKEVADRIAEGASGGKSVPEIIGREEVLNRLAEAMIQHGDKSIIAAALDHASLSSPNARAVVHDDIAVVTKAVALVIVVITAIDVTPRVRDPILDIGVSADNLRTLAEALAKPR